MEESNKAKIKNLKLFDLLQTLIYADDLDRIELLTELHINLINQVDKNGQTALHYSTLKGRENITISLLEKMNQQTINKADNFNRTALHYAIINGKKDTIIYC